MTTQQQAYIQGFVKRASEYGYSQEEAVNILKKATAADAPEYQKAPGLMQGLKNYASNVNPINVLKGAYKGIMGDPNAVDYPSGVPYMTSGPVGEPGISGIPQRLSNASQYMLTHKNPLQMMNHPMITTPAK